MWFFEKRFLSSWCRVLKFFNEQNEDYLDYIKNEEEISTERNLNK